MFGVPDKIAKLKDGTLFSAKKLHKNAPEPKQISGIRKDIGKKFYSPRIRSEVETDMHRERFRQLGQYYLDGTFKKPDEFRGLKQELETINKQTSLPSMHSYD